LAQALREKGGVSGLEQGSKEVEKFVSRYELVGLPERIKWATASFPHHRSQFISNFCEGLSLTVQSALALAQVDGYTMPSFEDRYRAITRHEGSIQLVDVHEVRENLRSLLQQVGYNEDRLLNSVQKWEDDKGLLDLREIPRDVANILAKLILLTKERLMVPLNIKFPEGSPWRRLEDVPFDGFDFKITSMPTRPEITGSQAYFGGFRKRRPTLRGLFEYNDAYPMTFLSLISLCLHEVMPGHYFHNVVTDVMPDLGFEASIPTMCSPQVTLWEGVAQNTLNLLFDTRDEAYTEMARLFNISEVDVQIQCVIDELLDAGKHNGPILYQRERMGEGGVRDHAIEMYALTGPLPTKIMGWAKHPLIGPMYGVGYDYGNKTVARMIREHGRLEAAKVAFNTRGVVDIETFQELLSSSG